MKIFKYPLGGSGTSVDSDVSALLPAGARVLAAGEQEGLLVVWAAVDPEQPLEPLRFFVCWTGEASPDPDYFRHVSTFTSAAGLVWHLFVETAPQRNKVLMHHSFYLPAGSRHSPSFFVEPEREKFLWVYPAEGDGINGLPVNRALFLDVKGLCAKLDWDEKARVWNVLTYRKPREGGE